MARAPDWRTCPTESDSSLPDAMSHAEHDPSLPDAENTRVEDMSHAEPDPSLKSTEEEFSLQYPVPAEQSSSFAVT